MAACSQRSRSARHARALHRRRAPRRHRAVATADAATATEHLSIDELARTTVDALAAHRPSYIRLPLGWPGEYCRFEHPQDYIGFDGGGGIGSGPGMAVGAALALRGGDRLPVAILGDGDYLMGLTALWTGVHNRVPLLVIVSNNQSFSTMNSIRNASRAPADGPSKTAGSDCAWTVPRMNLATLAQGQGAIGLGPVRTVADLQDAIETGVARVRDGALCVIDVHVAPEYARAMSSSLMRHISTTS